MRKPRLEDFDHPIVFLFFLILALVSGIALIGMGLQKAGFDTAAAIFGQQAA